MKASAMTLHVKPGEPMPYLFECKCGTVSIAAYSSEQERKCTKCDRELTSENEISLFRIITSYLSLRQTVQTMYPGTREQHAQLPKLES